MLNCISMNSVCTFGFRKHYVYYVLRVAQTHFQCNHRLLKKHSNPGSFILLGYKIPIDVI